MLVLFYFFFFVILFFFISTPLFAFWLVRSSVMADPGNWVLINGGKFFLSSL